MKRNELRNIAGGTKPSYWQKIKGACVASATSLLMFLSCGVASAQTITVDGNPGDWPAVLASSSVAFKAYVKDAVNSHTDNTWTRGSQNTDPISGWHWVAGNTNDKTDLGNTGVAIINHKLYFFADLYANNGDAAIGFWLFKGQVGATAGGNFSGTHQEGDILVSVLFTHGHATATPTIYKWHSGALTLVPLSAAAENAAVNASSVASPWPYTPKFGSSGIYPANSFFEGFVNLDSVGTSFDGCFGSFLTETWESQSPHAALADLVVGGNVGTPLHVSVANDTVCAGAAAVFTASVTGGSAPYSYNWNSTGFAAAATYTVTPASASQAITVTVHDAAGCGSAAATAQLVVRATPNITGPGNAIYCSGASASAINFNSAVSGTTFTWTSTANVGFGTSGAGNIPAFTAVGGTAVTTATVTVIPSASGCTGNPVSFQVSVNPVPNVTVLDTNVCKGHIVALTGSPAGGTWSGYGVSGSSFDATALSPGVYTVSYWMYGTGGCIAAANASVTVKKCYCGCAKDNEGAELVASESVYPNPTTGSFVVTLPALKYDSRLTIFDLSGNVVEQHMIVKNNNSQELPFDLSRMSRGFYFIQVLSGDAHYLYKVDLR